MIKQANYFLSHLFNETVPVSLYSYPYSAPLCHQRPDLIS